jgi:hypothetical protein
MKKITVLLLLLALGKYVSAQTLDTVRVVSNERKFKSREHILLMFEVKDTVDIAGEKKHHEPVILF